MRARWPRRTIAILAVASVVGACDAKPPGSPAPASPVAQAVGTLPSPSPSPTAAPPTTTIRPTPTPTATSTPSPGAPIPAENYLQFPVLAIAAGGPCAIKVDHTLLCWSDGSVEKAPPGRFKAVGGDGEGACGLRTNGKLACWSNKLEKAPPGRFKALSTDGTCAIRSDDRLVCWRNVGDDDGNPRRVLSKVPGGRFATVANSCGIRADGSVACGDGVVDAPPMGSGPYKQVDEPCGIYLDGTLRCWSELGRSAPGGTFTAVAASEESGCAIRTDGTLACWGQRFGKVDDNGNEVPYRAPDGTFSAVSLAWGRACALRSDGIAVCWGEDAGAPTPSATVSVLAKPPYHRFPDLLLTGRRIPVRWKARPVSAPIASVDLGYTWSRWDGASSSNEEAETDEPVTWRTATASGSATFNGKRGYTYCFTAEATDTDGAKGTGYGDCASIPLDERDLEASAGWSKLQGAGFYASTALRTTNKGQTLTLPKIGSLALGVIATTCPTCGTIEVSFDGNGSSGEDDGDQSGSYRVSLRSSRTVNRALVLLTDNGQGGVAGKLTIKVVSSGRPVIIDGVVLAPYET